MLLITICSIEIVNDRSVLTLFPLFLIEMNDLVQSSEHGVIIVSFGSILDHLPQEILKKLINAFGRRKELFLMR